MTVSSVSNLLQTYQVSNRTVSNSAYSQVDAAEMPQDPPAEVSKTGNLMSKLEDLLKSDPEKFKEKTAEIATKLSDASKTAEKNGDTRAAKMLGELSEKFQKASEDGAMPDLRPKGSEGGPGETGGPRGGRPMGGPPPGGGPPPADSESDNDSDDSTASSSSSSSTSTENPLQKSLKDLIKALEAQSYGDPMTTANDTIESVLKA